MAARGWGRTERCSGCGVLLLVPPNSRSIRCSLCRALTDIWWPRGYSPPSSSSSSATVFRHLLAPPPPQSSGAGAGGIARTPSGAYPAAHGRKRALLCGVSYVGRRYELKGTVNDVNCMRYLLRQKFAFPDQSILVLTEEEKPSRIPTKENVRAAMRWLVAGTRAGDSLVFHFSGHGAQRPSSRDRDEADGFDETLCPVDYEANGMILDDEVDEALVRPLPTGARLHAVVDSCHSGTVLDLPYLCRMNRASSSMHAYTIIICRMNSFQGVVELGETSSGGRPPPQWEEQVPASGAYKGTNGGIAICFSGCNDHQTSADTSALSRSVTTGAMTYSFIQAVESDPGMTYGRILAAMRAAIRGADVGPPSGPVATLLRKVFNCGLNQEPQLSSSEVFDIYRKPLIM